MIYTFVSSINNIFVHWLTSQSRCSSPQVHVFSWRFSTHTSTPDIFLTSSFVSLPGCSSQTDSSSAHGECLFHFIYFISFWCFSFMTNCVGDHVTTHLLNKHSHSWSSTYLWAQLTSCFNQMLGAGHQTVFNLNQWAFGYRAVWIDRTNRKVGKFKTLWLDGFLGSFILSIISMRRQILRYLQQMLYILSLYFCCASDFVPIDGSHMYFVRRLRCLWSK